MKRWIAILLAVCLVWALAGCHKENVEETPTQPATQPPTQPVVPAFQVGLCLPDRTALWENRAKELQAQLQKQGYGVSVQYADGSAQEQAKQLQKLIQEGANLLVVASVDAHTLQQELDSAAMRGVKVVTLDRQVLHTKGVSAAVTFDYMNLGVSLGYQIAEAKELSTARAEKRSYTIEFLMGSAEDQNAVLLHQGVMAVLQPYLDAGVLVCKTGRVSLEDTYVQGWKTENAQSKFTQYLEAYGETVPDIVCTVSDDLAAGCVAALEALERPVENWPNITGIGGSQTAIRYIMDGKQASTIYQDGEKLYAQCGEIIRCLLEEEELPQQENQAVAEYPTYICPSMQVNGIEGIGKLLDDGLSPRQLSLTEADLDRLIPPEEAQPPETTEPTQPETTEPTQPETTEPTQPETTAPTEAETKPAT